MDIRMHAKVSATDGPAGRVLRVVLNPDTGQVSHIVVGDEGRGQDPWLVPVQLVRQSEPDEVQLSVDRAALNALEAFYDHEAMEVHRPRPPGQTLGGAGYVTGPAYDLPQTEYVDVTHERVPDGEVAVRPGAKVHATDGPAGEVRDFLVDLADGRISHLVLREGHFWGRHDVQIPLSAVQRLEGDGVYLKLSKAEIGQLPPLGVRQPTP
jgi:sporulation protein YlmC with PRC-barrel domain